MSPDFNLCEICRNTVPKEFRFFVAVGNQLDGAGSRDDMGENIDLCHYCCVRAIQCFLKSNINLYDYDAGLKLKKWIDREITIQRMKTV